MSYGGKRSAENAKEREGESISPKLSKRGAPRRKTGAAPARRPTGAAPARRPAPKRGKANAARVSRGTEVDTWRGLSVKEPERNRGEHITVTVVIYNTVAGGVPSAEDVEAAVDDMEALYTACRAQGRLADASFDFMKAELTVNDAQQIETKIKTQPYEPPSVGVEGGDIFPAAAGA